MKAGLLGSGLGLACGLTLVAVVGVARGDGAGDQTRITIWRGDGGMADLASALGGMGSAYGYGRLGGYEYGGGLSLGGASSRGQGFVTHRGEFDVPASGDVTIGGLADSLDPASLQVRSVTDPTGSRGHGAALRHRRRLARRGAGPRDRQGGRGHHHRR
jgi:hypothetical protein